VLPNPEHRPPAALEDIRCLRIPLHCRKYFGAPPLPIGARQREVPGTAMPVAAIDENRDSLTPKHQVCTSTQPPFWPYIHAVA
jgi:hypothetical protein